MNKIAVMSYNTEEIDIITLDYGLKTNEDVEKHLQNYCNYNLDEIHWMEFDKGKVNFLTNTDFEQ